MKIQEMHKVVPFSHTLPHMADIKTGYTVNRSLWSFLNHFGMDIPDVEIVVVCGN